MEKKKVFGFCCTEQGKKCSEKEIQQWKNKYSQQLRGEKFEKKEILDNQETKDIANKPPKQLV